MEKKQVKREMREAVAREERLKALKEIQHALRLVKAGVFDS